MPVTRFIEIYYRFGLAEREGYEQPGARLKYMTQCVTLMVKYFRKKKAPLDAQALRKDAVQDVPFAMDM